MPRLSPKRPPKPLDSARLEDLALAYVARFATSAAKLEAYLRRKLRERGWAGNDEPPIEPLIERFVSAGYVDDRAFAVAKAGGLLRRGFGRRRINQALGAAGISEDIRKEVGGGVGAHRQAALALAVKRRFGPFGIGTTDRALREKQVAAMLRAGHPLDNARRIVDADDVGALEDWARSDDDKA